MIAIENKDYIVELNLFGGQIASFRDKKLDIEYMWNADPDYWAYSSPTLFPVIGSSHDNKYHFNGQTTSMPNHGVLRTADFDILKNTKDQAVLELVANSETLKQYPFYFKIVITYTLDFNKLLIEYEVINEGVIDMPFNFGLHPAFNVPLTNDKNFDDYKLVFSSPTKLFGCGPKVNEGLVSEVALHREDFIKHPTFLYHNINSAYLSLTDGIHGVKLSLIGFPITAIWTPNDKEAPFVCVEPWLGLGKKTDKDLSFKTRDAIMNIKANKKRLFTYSITVF